MTTALNLTPLDLIDAHPWQRVAFTTYAVSLSFFEAVILDRLVRGGGSQALILADVQGVRASLSEKGAQRVGKDYQLEPVLVRNGVFHPKITLLTAGDECHLLVGSGNLTFGGWGGNCEVLEHLHASFAADALTDAADFFEQLMDTARVRVGAPEHCTAIAGDLRLAVAGKTTRGDIRLIHNLRASIEEQICGFANELGGATRLVAMAPFFDGGAAVGSLCTALALSEVFVHAHEHGRVEGTGAQNWPRNCTPDVHAVRLDLFDGEEPRRLHAKAFEILCKRGRIVVSGSANCTTAALSTDRNVEACVVRLQRGRSTGWRHFTARPLDPHAERNDQLLEQAPGAGVLRAVLNGDRLCGDVLTPKMTGEVAILLVTATGLDVLATTTLASNGAFDVRAPLLEERSFKGGRLDIRVQDASGRQADGFVSVTSFGDIARRAGLVGRRLFALLAGTETPTDVAAIMSWFYEDPERLGSAPPPPAISGSLHRGQEESDQLIPVAALSDSYSRSAITATAYSHASQRNWSRFMDHVLAAFRGARTPFGQTVGGVDDDDDDRDSVGSSTTRTYDASIDKSLAVFERLLALLTAPDGPPRNALIAFDLTQYVCARLRPDAAQAKAWLERLIRVLLETSVPAERRRDVAAAVLTLAAIAPEIPACRWARLCVLRLGVDLAGEPPELGAEAPFSLLLPPRISFRDLWQRLRDLRTYPEQVSAYLQALEKGEASEEEYPDLRRDVREEWPILEEAITAVKTRQRLAIGPYVLDTCPHCFVRLPTTEAAKLRSMGIATAKGCCSRVVISVED